MWWVSSVQKQGESGSSKQGSGGREMRVNDKRVVQQVLQTSMVGYGWKDWER